MKTINIQSISDLITNSSTEVFVVYDEGNVDSIKKLVNSILSLLDSSKTFDDYFNIEMSLNYDELIWIFEKYYENTEYYEDIPELETYAGLARTESEVESYLESLPLERVKEIFDWANDDDYYRYRMYEGFAVTPKSTDPIVQKVATVINSIDNIFDIDYSSDY